MSFETNDFTLGKDLSQFQGFDNWNPTLDDESHSRTSSTNIVSPASDLGLMNSINESLGLQQGGETNPSNYLYNMYAKPSSSASGSSSTSASMPGPPFQNVFNNGFPIDTSFSTINTNQFMNTNYQDLTSNEYMKSAAALQAAQNMFGNYNITHSNATTTNPVPTSVAPNALFQNNLQDIPIDQAPYTTTNRSPSPLFEVDETPSPELTEVHQPRRRASESLSSTPRDGRNSKRRGFSLSIPQDRSRLDPDEKANRAAAAEGLSKGDKRRMQNKLAQRAFRARSKIVNKHAAGRLEDLEELTEQQTTRIGHLTELVGRLQKENYALKSSKFQEALMKGGMPQS